MKTNNKSGVFAALRMAARAHYPLTIGTLLCVAASVIASLLPPLLLARIIDGLAAGLPLPIAGAEAVEKSWPNFFEAIKPLGAEVEYAG